MNEISNVSVVLNPVIAKFTSPYGSMSALFCL